MRTATALLIAVTVLFTTAHAEPEAIRKRIAVFEFEDKTDGSLGWWQGGQSVGQGLADGLITALVKSERYIVVERSKLNEVMAEQSLGASGAVDDQTAASIGKILGVEIAVFGAVTHFGITEDKKGGRVPVMGPPGMRGRRLGVSVSTAEAQVVLDVRLVNTSTGEIIAAESVRGVETKRGVSLSNAHMTFKNEAEFDESMIGKATRKALKGVVMKINAGMAKVPWSGKVVKSEATTVIINAGSSIGVSVGDTLIVYAAGEELIDPDTGLSLGSEETRIGTVVVTSDIAEGKAAKCTVIEGSGGARGDVVRYQK